MAVGVEPSKSPVVSLINLNKNKLEKKERKETNARIIIDSICRLTTWVD